MIKTTFITMASLMVLAGNTANATLEPTNEKEIEEYNKVHLAGDLLELNQSRYSKSGVQPMEVPKAWVGYEQVAKDYEKGRPEYPKEAVYILADALQLGSNKQVLDLAAGTGKLTKSLQFTGAYLLAVEPVASMRAVFHEQIPTVPVLDGQAEKIPLSSESLDAVVVGTAFHWFDGEKALKEIARTLKPEGRLGLIWNIFDEEIDWVKQLRLLWQAGENRNAHDQLHWQRAFSTTPDFSALHHETFRYSFAGTAEDILDRLFSAKAFGTLSDVEKADLVKKTRQLLASHPATRGNDTLQIPYRVEIYWCSRLKNSSSVR